MTTKRKAAADSTDAQLARRLSRAKAEVAKQVRPAPAPAAQPRKVQEVSPEQTTTPCMREIGGSSYGIWNDALLHRTMMTASRLVPDGEDPAGVNKRSASIAGLGLRSFRPADPVQAMIAAQAVGLHLATMECLRLAMANVQHPDVASKLRKDAANLSRAMIETTEALQRRKGKGRQTIRVEKVTVEAGAQAIVGDVTHGAAIPTSGMTPRAIERDASPMRVVEAAVLENDEGEGT